jgi:hypothetical protein
MWVQKLKLTKAGNYLWRVGPMLRENRVGCGGPVMFRDRFVFAFLAFFQPELGNKGPGNARRIPARIPINPDIGLTSASGFW